MDYRNAIEALLKKVNDEKVLKLIYEILIRLT